MFNKAKYIIFILFMAYQYTFGQCVGCPPSISAPDGIGQPSNTFNGFTSEANFYDGSNPDCYMPVSNSLNGQLKGIDNQLCILKSIITGISDSYDSLSPQLDSLIANFNTLQAYYDSLSSIMVTALDNTITVNKTTSGDSTYFDLSVNYDAIEDSILVGLNLGCLDSVVSINQVLNDLITLNCDTISPFYTGGCDEFDPFVSVTTSALLDNVQVTVNPQNLLGNSPNVCVRQILYTYAIYDEDDNIVVTGLVQGATVLNEDFSFNVGLPSDNGNRYISMLARIYRRVCNTNVNCEIESYTVPKTLITTAF